MLHKAIQGNSFLLAKPYERSHKSDNTYITLVRPHPQDIYPLITTMQGYSRLKLALTPLKGTFH